MIESWVNSFFLFLNRWGFEHPIHPALVHMPIGLVVGTFILGWLAFLLKKEQLARSARHCLIIAAVFWFPVSLFGFMDWQHFYASAWTTPIKAKIILCGTLLILLLTALSLGFKEDRNRKTILTIYTLSFFTVVLLGFFGAQLVYGKAQETSKTYEAGQKIFSNHCVVCHPGGRNIIEPRHPIVNSPKLKTLKTFVAWIRKPFSPMPPFTESKISAKQVEELYAYLSNVISRPQSRYSGGDDGT